MRARSGLAGRVGAVYGWLTARGDTPLVRLSLDWFRRYFEASRNSGSAATVYMFLSVAPLMLAVVGLLDVAGSDTNAFAERLVDHQNLTGPTAELVRDTFGSAADNALAASLAAAVSFLLWGIGIGQIYQDVYARAWRIQVKTLSDQARFTVWFFVCSGLLVGFVIGAEELRDVGWAATIAVWLIGSTLFWLWTPRYLLHKQVGLLKLLPGALLASGVIGGATATSPLFLGPTLTADGKTFGSFGVIIALLFWTFTLVTLSMACAVFSPVWAEWRRGEERVEAAQPS